MRAEPTLKQNTGSNMYRIYRNNGNETVNSFSLDSRGTNKIMSATATASGGTGGQIGEIQTMDGTAFVAYDAEL